MSPSLPAPFEDLKALNNLKHSKFALRVWDLVRQVRGPFEVDVDTLRFCSTLLGMSQILLCEILLIICISQLRYRLAPDLLGQLAQSATWLSSDRSRDLRWDHLALDRSTPKACQPNPDSKYF